MQTFPQENLKLPQKKDKPKVSVPERQAEYCKDTNNRKISVKKRSFVQKIKRKKYQKFSQVKQKHDSTAKGFLGTEDVGVPRTTLPTWWGVGSLAAS